MFKVFHPPHLAKAVLCIIASTFLVTFLLVSPLLAASLSFTSGASFGIEGGNSEALAIGDLDQDTFADIVTLGENGADWVYFNDGDGTFDSRKAQITANFIRNDILKLADIDCDGDLDVVSCVYQGPGAVYFNDGDGTFDTKNVVYAAGNDFGLGLAVGDLNKDTYPDIVRGTLGDGQTVYISSSHGDVWSPHSLCSDGVTLGLQISDFDKDGDNDIFGNSDDANTIYINSDGSGTAFTTHEFAIYGQTQYNAVGDLNGDTWPDIVLSYFSGDSNWICFNDGDGTFDGSPVAFSTSVNSAFADVTVHDFDKDGDLDIALLNEGKSSKIYLNTSGTFNTSVNFGPISGAPIVMAVGDLDDDSDSDIALNMYDAQNRIYLAEVTAPPPSGPGQGQSVAGEILAPDYRPIIAIWLIPAALILAALNLMLFLRRRRS